MDSYPEIRDLQLLLVLAQKRHFTHAAADCGISQPAFSARIRLLEEGLGVSIVRRGNKFLGFTQEGELVLKWASRIVADAEGLRQEMEISQGTLRGSLTIGVVPTALTYAADVSTLLRTRYPALAIQLQSLTSSDIARKLLDYSLDAGITYGDEHEATPVKFEPIYAESYVLLSPTNLLPGKSGAISWSEAADVPLCLLSKDMHFRQIVDDVFSQAGVQPEPVMETNAFTAALAQVTNGSAATIAPAKLVASLHLDKNTTALKLNGPVVQHQIGLATLHLDRSLPTIDALRDAMKSHDS